MNKQNANLWVGLVLIGLGLFFLLAQFFAWPLGLHWPLFIVGGGAIFLFLARTTGTSPLAIPGSIIGGIGLLLYYQSLSGNWGSWAYAWSLIPGFVGIGVALMHLMDGRPERARREASPLLIISLILFVIFGSFLGGWASAGLVWSLLLIGAGGWLLLRNVWAR